MQKRDETHAEIYALREELQVLKDVIRSKQERLRKMNQVIVTRYRSSDYLRLVSSQPMTRKSAEALEKEVNLCCLDGGKAG